MKTRSPALALLFAFLLSLFSGCAALPEAPVISLDEVPAYAGEPYVAINGNVPYFTEDDLTTDSFESYSPLDLLNRCGPAYANVGLDLMPTEERGSIGQVKPSGWVTAKYDFVDGKYLYNRCHLIGFQLTGENAREENLITGTRSLNISGMLPFENQVADYVQETGNHVLYRVTPIFEGNNLLASGVLMEGWSVEDQGEGVAFCVYAYNAEPGVEIDYATGENWPAPSKDSGKSEDGPNSSISNEGGGEALTYIGNRNSQIFHRPTCANLPAESNRVYFDSRAQAVAEGYTPCGGCKP